MIALAGGGDKHSFVLLSVTPVEFRSALRRREREGDLTADQTSDVLAAFAEDIERRFTRQVLSDSTLEEAIRLVDAHALRVYDALQLAGCVTLAHRTAEEGPVFACSDAMLLGAAAREGIGTFDPAGQRGEAEGARSGGTER